MRDYNESYIHKLLTLLSQSSENAFKEIYELYAPFVFRTLVKITRSVPDSEEAVQDIFIKIWNKRASLYEISNFKNYLFIIARNHAITILKKMVSERLKQEKWQLEEFIDVNEDKDTLEKYYHLLDEAIETLPKQQKIAYLLYKSKSLKYEDIAKQMSISKESVKKYLKIAKSSIKKRFLESLKEIHIFFF